MGYSVAVLPNSELTNGKKAVSGAKSGVYQQATVPGSFSIATYYGVVFGNFWVLGAMPVSHGAHLVDFTVDQVNFVNANSGTHFVQVHTSVSDSDFASDFDGKGFYFGLDATFCGASTPVYTLVSETRTINRAATNVVVWHQTKSPNTCAASQRMYLSDFLRALIGRRSRSIGATTMAHLLRAFSQAS